MKHDQNNNQNMNEDTQSGVPPDSEAKQDTPAEAEDLSCEHQLELCQQQAGEYLSGWQRAQADYQNLQKDTAKRISENIKYATEGLLMELLPMVDHFKYAFNGIPEAERDSSWLKGIEYIQTNFMKILEEHGLEVIPTTGEQFNPELHEALEEVEADGGKNQKSGEIAEEVATGFKLNGKIIQCAKVKVIK